MSKPLSKLDVGGMYSNEDIFKALGVGNAGGLRFNISGRRVVRGVVLTALPSARKKEENPYHDRIEDGILTYTAAGREGDQALSGMNARLYDQLNSDFPLHGFILVANRKDPSLGPKRWKYLGLLEFLRHFRDTQLDCRGVLRSVWIFELRVHATPAQVPLEFEAEIMRDTLRQSRLLNPRTLDELSVVSAPTATSMIDPLKVEAVRAKLLSVSPKRFEHVLKELLEKTGFNGIEVTKYSQDGGIDLTAYPALWALGRCLLQIQAKRWIHTVGRKEVAELRGSLDAHARGALITTSHFTRAALADANAPGKVPIHLVDGFELAQVVIRNKAQSLCVEN